MMYGVLQQSDKIKSNHADMPQALYWLSTRIFRENRRELAMNARLLILAAIELIAHLSQ